MTVIYADILIAINLAVDYLVLFGTARLAGICFERLKGLVAAAMGAVFSLIIIFDFPQAVFAAAKLAVSFFMVRIAFGKRKLKDFICLAAVFYICGFIFCGFMMLLNSFVHADSFFVKGGIIYFEFSAAGIVFSASAAFVITEILRRIFRRGEPDGNFIAKIYYGENCAVLKGFTDTGNSLSEPFSGTPVAVAQPDLARKILPESMTEAIKTGSLSTEYGIRMIPAKTVAGSVLMPAFRPKRMIIENEKGEFEAENIMIAISENVPENTIIIGKNVILKEREKIFSEV